MDTLEYIIDNIDGILKYLDSLDRCKEEYFDIIEIGGKELDSCEYFEISQMGNSRMTFLNHELFGVEPFNVVLCVLYKKI